MKKIFKKNKLKTEQLKDQFKNSAEAKGYEWIGVFEYKDIVIFFDKCPIDNKILKHISMSRKDYKEIPLKDLKVISKHFLGEKYLVEKGQIIKSIINVWEEI